MRGFVSAPPKTASTATLTQEDHWYAPVRRALSRAGTHASDVERRPLLRWSRGQLVVFGQGGIHEVPRLRAGGVDVSGRAEDVGIVEARCADRNHLRR